MKDVVKASEESWGRQTTMEISELGLSWRWAKMSYGLLMACGFNVKKKEMGSKTTPITTSFPSLLTLPPLSSVFKVCFPSVQSEINVFGKIALIV